MGAIFPFKGTPTNKPPLKAVRAFCRASSWLYMDLMGAYIYDAKAIIYGIPDDLSPKEKEEGLLYALGLEGFGLESAETPESNCPVFCKTYESMELKASNGWKRIPIGFLGNDGVRWSLLPMRFGFFAKYLNLIQEHLVSLNGSAEHPQPVKYLECEVEDSPNRHFLEVQLWMDPGMVFRLEILGRREEPRDVRVSPYATGEVASPPEWLRFLFGLPTAWSLKGWLWWE